MRCTIPETYAGLPPEIPPYPADLLVNVTAAFGVVNLTQAAIGQAVVRLRRGGDGAQDDFTALQITDGTAVAWALDTGGDGNATIETWYNQKGLGGDATALDQDCYLIEAGVVNTVNGVPCPRWDAAHFQALSTYQSSASLVLVALDPVLVNTDGVYGSTNQRRICPMPDRVFINWTGTTGAQNLSLPNNETGFAIMGCWSEGDQTTAFRNEDERSTPAAQDSGSNISGGRWGARNGSTGQYSGRMGGIVYSIIDSNSVTRDNAIQSFMNIYGIV